MAWSGSSILKVYFKACSVLFLVFFIWWIWCIRCICGFSAASIAYGREDLIPGSRYTSAAGAAMGDAYLPMGTNVASGLFNNPADLGKLRRFELEPLDFMGYFNGGYLSTADANFYQVTSLSSYSGSLQKAPGKSAGVGGQLTPTLGFSAFGESVGVGFGILALSQLSAKANGDGTVSYQSLYQMIPSLGVGFRAFDGVLRLGYSLQWVNEALGARSAVISNTIGYDQGLAQGSGFSHNLGATLIVPMVMLPELDIVARNVLNTSYSPSMLFPLSSSPTGVPETEPMSVDASFSIEPRIGKGIILNLVIVDRDVTNRSGDLFIGHFALGTEINVHNKFFLRGGFGGGYPSAGIGLRRPGAEVSFAWYTEEIGRSYLSNGDSRFVLQYQLRSF